MISSFRERYSELRPTVKEERFEILDVLRGFALYGVLMSNLVWFYSGYGGLDPEIRASFSTVKLDSIVFEIETFLVPGKFVTIFSFLFGIGFSIQLNRTIQKRGKFRAFYAGRMMWLFLIGFISIFFMGIDILHLYAILGVFLIFSHSLNDRQLMFWGVVCSIFFPVLMRCFVWMSSSILGDQWDLEKIFDAKWDTADKLKSEYYRSDYFDVLKANFADAQAWFTTDEFTITLVSSFGLFLLGYFVGRSKILMKLRDGLSETERIKFHNMLKWSLFVGVSSQIILWLNIPILKNQDIIFIRALRELLWRVEVLALALFYICVIIYAHERMKSIRIFHYFAVVGRMALTNYVGQSFIAFCIFYGLGIYGKVGPALSVVFTTAIFGFQILYSHWWLKRLRYGPLEWLWRTLTYGKIENIRLTKRNQV